MKQRSAILAFLALVLPWIGITGYRTLRSDRAISPASITVQTASVSSAMPALPFFREFTDFFRKNDTITDALSRHGLNKQQILELVTSVRSIWPHTKVVAGASFEGNLYPNGDFHEFRYRIDSDRYITVYRNGDKFVPLMKNLEREARTEVVEGVILDSLFNAISDAGEQPQLAINLADIFTYDVDFYADIHKGDRFRLLIEKKYLAGKLDGYGNISAAELTLGKKQLSAFRFQNEFYDAGGKSLKKSLLRSPLKFAAPITSKFSKARLHPILRIVRPHEGVDYAAPTGTPVVAVASGTVVSSGYNGGFGNSVRMRHDNGLETMYSHLSRIAVSSGERVSQGELVGYVGATGLATGPHLDFRLFERGKPMDPTKKIVPDAPPVSAQLMPRFLQARDELRGQFDLTARETHEIASATPGGTVGIRK
jgi:murein DD-endopeptidase MepM/ murein hydrolase activator NlpD